MRTSKGIIPYYVTQWLCVGWWEMALWNLGLDGSFALTELQFWLMGFGIIIISLQAAKGWLDLKHRLAHRGEPSHD